MELLCLLLSLCGPSPHLAVSVFMCGEQSCGDILREEILLANQSVDCAFFELDLTGVADALSQKKARLILDGQQKGLRPFVDTRFDTGKAYMHDKFCVIDQGKVITGSFNPTRSADETQDNVLILLDSREIASLYETEFAELWRGEFGQSAFEKKDFNRKNPIVEVYFCPEDSCKLHVIHEILNARQTVHFMAFSFTHEDIADALLMSKANVSGVIEKLNAHNASQFPRLSRFGIDVRKDGNPSIMHHKTFIIDSSVVLTGSFNPTVNADTKNDENLLIIRDSRVAAIFEREFSRVLEEAGG